MTYEEKAQEEHPEINADRLEDIYCPSDFAYDEPYNCEGMTCNKCWNREIPEEE